MTVKPIEQERDAVDLVTECMYSVSFLQAISDLIFSEHRNKVAVGEFYDQWLKKTEAPRKAIIPLNPGIILAHLYVGILFSKENWFDLVPADGLTVSHEKWGLRDVKVHSPKEPNPTVRYAVRRIRNSLGHGHPIFSIPPGATKENFFARTSFSFHDVNMHDSSDTFDVTLTLDQLLKLVKKFQSTIHKHVRDKG
jgi:hypothetical protein